ncbi:uncharacterized protein PHACADRAFT_145790 [Phanerochaete carnosa HHB-10118-sp]|uniref:Cytochrome P450 n=1 Tax=Phanerochaete carnosa (strain HHB-10118-sp) TaxID=650164 RepID=K5W5A7_PHACS|nr:uncharacterized protein PHACADRAFT_145790 [Phanerochaete carnosa HHB-10118-sp]EKM54139.1 hypothetical protein PHACADRAFT_145790 [Phanerochaete carnosa HHB-10118-sp]
MPGLSLESPDFLSLIWKGVLPSWVLYSAVKAVYNLYFHPLARFPGPKLAAASDWWQAYIEVFKAESLSKKLVKLHEEFGDIVRVAPNELHFAKPSAYHEIYNVKNRWDRDMKLYHIFADEVSTLTIPDYPTAKKRRDISIPLFSRKNVIEMQHLVQQCLDTTCENIDKHIKEGKSVNIYKAFRCCAVDIVFTICFARSMNATSEPDFSAPVIASLHAAMPVTVIFKHFPMIQKLVSMMPAWLLVNLRPELDGYAKMRKMLTDQVKEAKTNPQALADYHQPTIYHEFLKDPKNIPSDKSLRDEAVLFVNAGTDTASNTIIAGVLNILANPEILARLQQELVEAWPNLDNVPRFEQLEKLPYLTAVLKESLRTTHGVVQPMTRVVPKEGAQISGRFIPGGSVVGISNTFVHLNEDIFRDACAFKPERWLDSEGDLDTWLVAFSKGPRSCLGINLGWCELYMSIANLVRRYDLKLDGVGPSDWVWRDLYLPHFVGPDLMVKAQRRTV